MKVAKSRVSLENIFKAAQKAVLTPSDIAKLAGFSPLYLEVALHRAVGRGIIKRLERGKYCLIDTNSLAIASNILFPSYVSFLSAFVHHNLTTQIPTKIYVVSTKSRKFINIGDYEVGFVAFSPNRLFGYDRINLDGHMAFIASPEKAIVDSLYLPQHCPISETFFAIQNFKCDLDKILDYAKRMDCIVLLKRLGYLFDVVGVDLLKKLKPLLNRKMDMLNPLLPAKGAKNQKWKIIVNERFK